MNLNANSHFAKNAESFIGRSTMMRPAGRTFTCDAGVLIPFYVDEVLPGDTFEITTGKVIRMQTLLSLLWITSLLISRGSIALTIFSGIIGII